MVHYYHIRASKQNCEIPSQERMASLLPQMLELANAWEQRQPHDEWRTAVVLREWHERISKEQ